MTIKLNVTLKKESERRGIKTNKFILYHFEVYLDILTQIGRVMKGQQVCFLAHLDEIDS